MDMTTPLSIGLAIAFFGFAAGGIAIVLWLQKILAGQKDELLHAIADARSAVDEKVDELEARIQGMAEGFRTEIAAVNARVHAHELSVRDRFEMFLSKQTFRDVSVEIKQTIATGLDRMEARMMRLEGYMQPSGTLSNALRRIEQAQTREGA